VGNLETEKLQEDITKKKTNDDGTSSSGGDGRAKADQGQLQKKIKRMLKIMLAICKKQKSIALLSGHFYGSPTSYGSAEEIGGGKHIKLAPHIIISLKKAKIKEGSAKDAKIIGNQINAITLKNRFYPAFQQCTINIDYQKGVDRYSGLEKLAIDAGLIEKAGGWYTNTITGEKVHGAVNIGELMTIDMLKQFDEHIKQTGYSTVNREMEETLKEADDIIEEKELHEEVDNVEKPVNDNGKKSLKKLSKNK
jgi:hypothetical protein